MDRPRVFGILIEGDDNIAERNTVELSGEGVGIAARGARNVVRENDVRMVPDPAKLRELLDELATQPRSAELMEFEGKLSAVLDAVNRQPTWVERRMQDAWAAFVGLGIEKYVAPHLVPLIMQMFS